MDQKIRKNKLLGYKIRDLHNSKELTQEQMVAKMQLRGLDTTRSRYSQIECGTYNIRVDELKAIVEILDVDFNTIFDFEKNQQKNTVHCRF